MTINPYDRANLQRAFPGCTFKALDAPTWKKGHTYFSGYWHEYFRVLDVQHDAPIWGTVYTVIWESGETTTHSTAPDPRRDFEIILPD